jgi:hypothetical protein
MRERSIQLRRFKRLFLSEDIMAKYKAPTPDDRRGDGERALAEQRVAFGRRQQKYGRAQGTPSRARGKQA